MKKYSYTALLILGICLSAFVIQSPPQTSDTRSRYIPYLGCSYSDEHPIPKQTFDSLIHLPLCARDSSQQVYKILSFDITYAERGLYQDSAGLPIIYTDYSSASFKGDTFTSQWKAIFEERSYKGDTIYFDNILAKASDDKPRLCRRMKIILK